MASGREQRGSNAGEFKGNPELDEGTLLNILKKAPLSNAEKRWLKFHFQEPWVRMRLTEVHSSMQKGAADWTDLRMSTLENIRAKIFGTKNSPLPGESSINPFVPSERESLQTNMTEFLEDLVELYFLSLRQTTSGKLASTVNRIQDGLRKKISYSFDTNSEEGKQSKVDLSTQDAILVNMLDEMNYGEDFKRKVAQLLIDPESPWVRRQLERIYDLRQNELLRVRLLRSFREDMKQYLGSADIDSRKKFMDKGADIKYNPAARKDLGLDKG